MGTDSTEMSFEEFRAFRNREKLSTEAKEKEKMDANPSKDKTPVKSDNNPNRLAAFAEQFEVQSLFFCLVVLDSFASFLVIFLNSPDADGVLSSTLLSIVTNTQDVFSKFTLTAFCAELILVLFAFGFSVFFHAGYLFDMIVLSLQIYSQFSSHLGWCKLLNIIRFWRIFRIISSLVNDEREKSAVVTEQLEASKKVLLKREVELETSQNDLVKEKESREAVEDMLQNYKDEVDTLNEALKIAAMDIAEVAQDDDAEGWEEEDDEADEAEMTESKEPEHGEEDEFLDAVSSELDKSAATRNKESLYRLVKSDHLERQKMRGGGVGSEDGKKNTGYTYVVSENGTFEQK